jgi:hypothetical protein
MQRGRAVVYWVIAKLQSSDSGKRVPARTVERLGPFESRSLAVQARDVAATRYRTRPEARVEVVCDFS